MPGVIAALQSYAVGAGVELQYVGAEKQLSAMKPGGEIDSDHRYVSELNDPVTNEKNYLSHSRRLRVVN